MNRGRKCKARQILQSLVFVGSTGAFIHAQTATPPVLPSTAAAEQYPEVTCTGTNAGLNVELVQLASDTRDELEPILQLSSKWRFPVTMHVVMPDDPLADRIKEERSGVKAEGTTMSMEIAAPVSDPDLKTFIQRQVVTSLLWEKFFANTRSFNAHTNLAVVPLWLVEGLNEWVRNDPGRDREEIVRRAATIQRAPTLKEITSWEEISDDRLLGIYQRAFCYYLVNGLIHGDAKRAEFKEWLATYAGGNPARANLLFPTEAGWQQELLDAPARSHDLVYTWEESALALEEMETMTLPGSKAGGKRNFDLTDALDQRADDDLTAAMRKKVFDLTALELRVHPSWRPILALYRFGLTAVLDGHPAEAENYFRRAERRRLLEAAYHRKLVDYANWFEVTKDYAGHVSRFDSYFSTARAMEEVQADPAKPNPIRADLIQVESQL